MATPLEDERFAAGMLQSAIHGVLSAMINDEVGESPADPRVVALGDGVFDRAALLVTAMEPTFRGLHPELVAEVRAGLASARAGSVDQGMIRLFRTWELLVVLAGTELDLPTRRTDETGR